MANKIRASLIQHLEALILYQNGYKNINGSFSEVTKLKYKKGTEPNTFLCAYHYRFGECTEDGSVTYEGNIENVKVMMGGGKK